MDAGAVADGDAVDDAGSLGARGVGPGLGKGRPPQAPIAPTRRLPPGATRGWDRYDKATNNGFPPGTCGGCGAEDHFRNDCPNNPNKGKFPPRKGKGKGKDGKGKWAKGKASGAKESEE